MNLEQIILLLKIKYKCITYCLEFIRFIIKKLK